MVIIKSSNQRSTYHQNSQKLNLSFLKDVIKKKRMSMCSLADLTGVPLTTMSRFLNGHTQKPTFQLVYDVSKCLNIDLNYLFEKEKSKQTSLGSVAIRIPVLEWNEINDWTENKLDSLDLIRKHWVSTTKPVSPKAFALQSSAVMEPHIPSNSVIIVSPHGQLVDQKWVLFAANDQTEPTIYKVMAYESNFYLKPLLEEGSTKRIIRMTPDNPIIGTIEEAVTFL
jgi:transcriptional regulator with XRE-family HTH domain